MVIFLLRKYAGLSSCWPSALILPEGVPALAGRGVHCQVLSGQPVICGVQDSRACPLPSSAVWRVCAIASNLSVLSGALPTLHQCSPLYTRPEPAERMPFSHLPDSFCPHSLAQALPLLGKPHCPLQIPPPLQTPPQFRQKFRIFQRVLPIPQNF